MSLPYPPYFSSTTTKSVFNSRFEAENGKILKRVELSAASSWGRPHMLACRVVRQDLQSNLLPILSLTPSDRDFKSLPKEIKSFLQGGSKAGVEDSASQTTV
ncbi:hypothetical protein BJY04DRAFT_202603 [Aspergillus karnatakaensis]|uniref:uncharacterized protein n=1 Tax=Aspergillus karnatakaensis TaxID=1810916 RepID=UPI003CCD9D4B